jgi:glycosyltransferase involved in cell wall biosynthesis
MKIIGLTRVRNEQYIIQDTLDHMSEFCDKIVVYDDASIDRTPEICRYHPKVKEVISNKHWDSIRSRAEWQNRRELLNVSKQHAGPDDWFVYMDADERIEFPWDILEVFSNDVIGFRCKLFDYYITPNDIELHYSQRKYLGPEYRNILMIFRNLPTLDYSSSDQREVHLRDSRTVTSIGYVKHYGKALSLKQWNDTCEYYGRFFPKYSAKWNARRGKAIHRTSSFGNELITWDQKEIKGFPLTSEIEKNSIY